MHLCGGSFFVDFFGIITHCASVDGRMGTYSHGILTECTYESFCSVRSENKQASFPPSFTKITLRAILVRNLRL